MSEKKTIRLLAIAGPGLLIAATGVGAGDLATAAFTGGHLGTAALWAVVVGAFFKYALNEGLARWQLATGQTLLEGAVKKFGAIVIWGFPPYLFLWSFFVGSALMSACGVTFHAILPLFENASHAKVVFGIAHSLLGLTLVLWGGFPLFERVMNVCIGVMFITAIATAACLWPGLEAVARGIFLPHPSTLHGTGLTWTVALMGGVGGTLTVLCYGYWIREKGRVNESDMTVCRIDLGVGYIMTALFGLSMVIIGSQVESAGSGALLIVNLAQRLEEHLGTAGKWAFLIGAWGAVFSSLLGVWQAVPYLFADFYIQARHRRKNENSSTPPVDTNSLPYRLYLFAIAFIPMLGLWGSFKDIQKIYAVIGACFMPLLALTLLILNSRSDWVGKNLRNRWPAVFTLVAILSFFLWILVQEASTLFG